MRIRRRGDTPDDGGAGTGGGASGGSGQSGGAGKAGGAGGAGGTTAAGGGGSAGASAGGSATGGAAGQPSGGSSSGGTSSGGSSTGGSSTGGSSNGGTSSSGGSSSGGSSSGGSSNGGTSSSGGASGNGTGGSGTTDPCANIQAKPEVFGHGPNTLYRVNPDTLAVTIVADFDCLGTFDQMIDIALDKTGQMYGTSSAGFVVIDKASAHCSYVNMGSYPNSLSFVPAGTVLPNDEALVGYNGDQYVRIDKTTGAVTTIGTLGGGYSSSGDIVSVINGGTYLTVNGNGCGDCVVEVDPVTGSLKQLLGDAGYADVYGIAFWAGIVYGFTSSGNLFTYDVKTKQSMAVSIPNAPSNLVFYGAGSTTCAPAIKP